MVVWRFQRLPTMDASRIMTIAEPRRAERPVRRALHSGCGKSGRWIVTLASGNPAVVSSGTPLAQAEPVKLNETSGGGFYLTGLLGLDGGAGLVDPYLGGQRRGCRAAGRGTGRGGRRRPRRAPAGGGPGWPRRCRHGLRRGCAGRSRND